MPKRRLRLTAAADARIGRRSLSFAASSRSWSAFPDDVVAEADRAAREVELPDADETEIPFVTIDPPESMDLDQAIHVERRGTGYRVRYAIADVAAFVAPGSLLDAEARRRVADALRARWKRTPVSGRTLRGSCEPPTGRDSARRSSGRWRWTRPAKAPPSTSGRRASGAVRSSSYGGAQRALDDGSAGRRCSCSCARSGSSANNGKSAAAASVCSSPSRRWRRARAGTTCPTGRRSRSRGGTRRSR